jgi:hypothetical protein
MIRNCGQKNLREGGQAGDVAARVDLPFVLDAHRLVK